MANRRIAFIRMGTFSNVNDCVYEALKHEFPDFQIDVIEVLDIIRSLHATTWFRLLAVAYAFKEFTHLLLTRREKLRGVGGCMIRTTFYFSSLQKRIQARLIGRDYAFTFQTQSVFDASLPGTPHFVYTDHAEIECLRFPGFTERDLFPRSWLELEKSIYHNARITFTMTPNITRCLVEHYDCKPDRVVEVGAGSNPRSRGDGSVNPAKYAAKNILFVALRWERKGGPELVEAFRQVLKAHPDAKLTIVGCSPQLNLPNCCVVGDVPLDQMNTYYEQATVFCLPTLREAFGQSFIEAFSHQLPVVATAIGPMLEYVRPGENGYLVAVGDIDTLAQRLIELLGDPARCQAMGENGYRMVTEEYNWTRTGARIAQAIRGVLGVKELTTCKSPI